MDHYSSIATHHFSFLNSSLLITSHQSIIDKLLIITTFYSSLVITTYHVSFLRSSLLLIHHYSLLFIPLFINHQLSLFPIHHYSSYHYWRIITSSYHSVLITPHCLFIVHHHNETSVLKPSLIPFQSRNLQILWNTFLIRKTDGNRYLLEKDEEKLVKLYYVRKSYSFPWMCLWFLETQMHFVFVIDALLSYVKIYILVKDSPASTKWSQLVSLSHHSQ